jgi:hypothetical protein
MLSASRSVRFVHSRSNHSLTHSLPPCPCSWVRAEQEATPAPREWWQVQGLSEQQQQQSSLRDQEWLQQWQAMNGQFEDGDYQDEEEEEEEEEDDDDDAQDEEEQEEEAEEGSGQSRRHPFFSLQALDFACVRHNHFESGCTYACSLFVHVLIGGVHLAGVALYHRPCL